MESPSSKELYMMNGGNKLYIYKDGFGDIYNATAEEESEWAKEIISNALARIDVENNLTVLQFAINDLVFHKYNELEALLLNKMKTATPARQVVFAAALWRIFKYGKSFELIQQNLLQHGDECLDEVFLCLNDFKNCMSAKYFLLKCIKEEEDVLYVKAHTTISMWAYTGIPSLRENDLLNLLRFENKGKPSFNAAVEQLEKILKSSK